MSTELTDNFDSQLQMARNVHDFTGLDKLRAAAQHNDKGALHEAAKQFESIFLQMMLKSMRQSNDVLEDEDSPLNSKQVKFYRDMHDQQLAMELAGTGGMGLADLIERQLGGDPNYTPANLVSSKSDALQLHQLQQTAGKNTESVVVARTDNGKRDSAFSSLEEFVSALLPVADKAAAGTQLDGISLLSQAAVETGWGSQMIHSVAGKNSHNLFGMKANRDWQGDKTLIDSVEYQDGRASRERSAFKSYSDFAASMQDYVSTLQTSPRYAGALQAAANPKDFFSQLQQAGYATDPHYADKIIAVMDKVRAVADKLNLR